MPCPILCYGLTERECVNMRKGEMVNEKKKRGREINERVPT